MSEIKRVSCSQLDVLLGTKFPILDDGFIRIIDYMGDDSSIVQAARVSYGAGTKKVNEDRGLIRYLMRHNHTTPFEMVELKLHIRVPMDCWRQWIRHRTASVNEYSTRYSEAIDSFQKTKPDQWRKQSKTNKQGSDEYLGNIEGDHLTKIEENLHNSSKKAYLERLSLGVTREQARKDLLLSTYTEAYWKIDGKNLLHFLALRMHKSAQKEIRTFAEQIGYITSIWLPETWEAFNDYNPLRGATILTAIDKEIIKAIHTKSLSKVLNKASELGLIKIKNGKLTRTRNRERKELEEKLKELYIDIPWKNKEVLKAFKTKE